MPTYTWTDGASADWGTAADWSGGVVPDGKSNATIGGTGTETVTVADSEMVNLLTLSDANATLEVSGILTVGGLQARQAIDVSSGLIFVGGSAATIDNTTLDLGAAGFAPAPGLPAVPTLGSLSVDEGTVLTFGSHLTVDVVYGQITGFGSLDNKAVITTVGAAAS